MAGIAIPQNAPAMTRRTLGSLVPHPANIGKVAGAHMGIKAPHLARGGIGGNGGSVSNAENITQNMFEPINPEGGIPNLDMNFITSPQLGVGKGPPAMQAVKPQQEQSAMQQIAQGTQAANGLTNLGGSAYKGIDTLWNGSAMSGADAAAYNSTNGLTAGSADYASAGDTIGGMGDWLASFFANGGAIPARADGGDIPGVMGTTNMLMRREAGETFHPSGLLNSAGPGRTDTINTSVPTGAYVIPADVVSGLGEGNTLAGSAVIDRMFSTAPHGIKPPKIGHGRGAPHAPSSDYANNYLEPQGVDTAFINNEGKYAKGGVAQDKAPVVVAGGEHVLSPQQIINKFGSLKRGHTILDHWVVAERKRIAQEMLKLPNPVGSRVKKK